MRLLEFLPFLLRIQARSAPEISTGRLVVALGGVIMRILTVAKTGEAPASEKCAWARTTLHSIAANPVRDEHPATRARQKEDLVDDVLTRHLHLTRLLVQGGQALQLCLQPVFHLDLQLRLHLRLDCFEPQICFEDVDGQVLSKVAVSKELHSRGKFEHFRCPSRSLRWPRLSKSRNVSAWRATHESQ